MNIIKLDWDTVFFSIVIGKIEINESTEFDLRKFLDQRKKFDLIYVFSKNLVFNKSVLDSTGLELKDVRITMSLDLKEKEFPETKFELLNSLSQIQLKDCLSIVRKTAEVSRFYHEPLIGRKKTEKFYEKWLFNALNQEYADGILIEKDTKSNKIASLFIPKTFINKNIGMCSIIGVHPIFKGQGYGTKIWNQAFTYWSSSGISNINVPFSLFNTPSFNFHLKMGFNKIIETTYIYHFKNLK